MKVKHLAGIVFSLVFALASVRCGVRGADDSVDWTPGPNNQIDFFDIVSMPIVFFGLYGMIVLLAEHAETEVWTRRKRDPKPKPVEQLCPECKRVSEYR